MTAARRTLEEIEALAAEATPGPWTTKGKSVKAVGAPSTGTAPNGWQGGICNCMGSGHGPRSRIDELAESNAALIAALPDLLAIAQGQREALLAIWPFVEEDDGLFTTPEYQAAINQVRQILGIGTKK